MLNETAERRSLCPDTLNGDTPAAGQVPAVSSVELLRDPQQLAALASEWDALDEQISPRTPFTSSLWNILWWQHFAQRRFFIRDELCACAVRDAHGRLLAVAPMMLTSRPGRGPLRVRTLQFFGTDPNVTELRGPVCRDGDHDRVARILAAHFLAGTPDWDWVSWGGIRRPAAATQAAAEPADVTGIRWSRTIPMYYLPLPASWAEFRAGLPRNIKESLRKCYNSLKRDGHEFTLRVVTTPEAAPAALQRLFDLHAMRAQAEVAVRHANVFAAQSTRSFIVEYTQQMARLGRLRVFQLEIGGQIVATRVGLLLGSELYLYYSGYDPEWGRYSVMTTVVAEGIQWAIANQLKIVNLSVGNDVSKLRWDPVEVLYAGGEQIAPRRLSRWALGAYQWVTTRRQRDGVFARLMRIARRG